MAGILARAKRERQLAERVVNLAGKVAHGSAVRSPAMEHDSLVLVIEASL